MTRFAVDRNHHAERTGSKLSNAIEAVDLSIMISLSRVSRSS